MSNTSCIELVSILILGNLNISCQSDLIYLNKETNLAVRFIGTLLPTVADRSGSLTGLSKNLDFSESSWFSVSWTMSKLISFIGVSISRYGKRDFCDCCGIFRGVCGGV